MAANKNFTKIIGLVLILVSGIIQFNCKKEVVTGNSPDTTPLVLKEAPIGFAVTKVFSYVFVQGSSSTTPISNGPDFANGATFYFLAAFNAEVTWTITISDATSGAVKTITNTSSEINQSNASWDGSHDGSNFFNPGDIIEAKLTIAGSNIELSSGNFTISSFIPFNGYKGYIMGENGYSASKTSGTYNVSPTSVLKPTFPYLNNWPWYVTGAATTQGAYGDTPADPFYGGIAVQAQLNAESNSLIPAQLGYTLPIGFSPIEGNGAYMLFGKDFNFDYFVAGIKEQTTWCWQPGETQNVFGVQSVTGGLPADSFPAPDQLYFNIYIYGTGDVDSYFHFAIEEDDNGDHVHYDTSEDVYYYVITTSHTGWKLFSVPYSDMLTAQSPKNGGKGNHIQQPNQITAVGLQVLSNPPGQTVKVIMDYPTITFGRPFNPNL